MTINSGNKIGIVGKVGGGKTTRMNILAGFYEVPENKIFINGMDMNELKKIGENGIKISGGQKQRIQIARNLLNVRNINIFDEPTSNIELKVLIR